MAMLGSQCSPCCTQCGCPPQQKLPDAVTVTFSGLTKSVTGKTGNLLGVKFTSCFGSGASATVLAPGGTADLGFPIASVTLASGGSGYAKLGRTQPVLSISGTGTGATFTPTLASSNDACGIPSWKITSVSVSKGTGYINGEQLSVAVDKGGTEVAAAVLTVETNRQQPTLTAIASGGSGASFLVTLAENIGSSPTTWRVTSVSVTSGGTGYSDGSPLSFSGGSALKVDSDAQAYIATGRALPTLTASVFGGGTGASISPTLTQYADWNGRAYWSVSGFTITNGGSGYAELDQVVVYISEGKAGPWSYFYAYVSSVDQDGKILAIAIDGGGEYFKDTGVIQSVGLWWGGAYHDDAGVPAAVSVSYGGEYFKEDPSEPPYVANVSATITQTLPSDGTGASLTATVNDNTSSPAFGNIVDLSLDSDGDGYLGWTWALADCDVSQFNENTFIASRTSSTSCTYRRCRGDSIITVLYRGESQPPLVSITGGCKISFAASEGDAPFSCSPLSFTANEILGGTAVVAQGNADGIPDCIALLSASSVTFEVTAQDWVRQASSLIRGIWLYDRNTVYWPGAKYQGTFELVYDRTTPEGARVFRYDYGGDSLFCSRSPFLEFVVTPAFGMGIQLRNATALYYRSLGDCPPKDASALECTERVDFVDTCGTVQAGSVVSSATPSINCPCDPDSFSGAFASTPSFSISSDAIDITSSEQGSRAVGFRYVSYSND